MDRSSKGRKRYKFKHDYESEKVPYVLSKHYIPDFVIVLHNGHKIYIEAKGYLRPTDRTKMIAVKKQNPELDIRFVFARDNKLNKNTATTYTQWADKHGFPWCISTIPKRWLRNG